MNTITFVSSNKFYLRVHPTNWVSPCDTITSMGLTLPNAPNDFVWDYTMDNEQPVINIGQF